MAMAASLTEAATLSYSQLLIARLASTLKTKYGNFITTTDALFSDQTPNDRPVGNWLPIMSALQGQMSSGVIPLDEFNPAVDLMFRICLGAASARASNLISNAQATAMLAAWNAQFGT